MLIYHRDFYGVLSYLYTMENTEKVKWIIKQHSDTNHSYDQYLPYDFHLRMVARVANQHMDLIPDSNDGEVNTRASVLLAAYGHDLIEDTRCSYNDVVKELGVTAADIIYACTNEKGKNRKERANDKYYGGIRDTPYAVFVKLCDRIANVQYSKMTGSRMFEMYKKENENFGKSLGVWNVPGYSQHPYFPLFAELLEIFESK